MKQSKLAAGILSLLIVCSSAVAADTKHELCKGHTHVEIDENLYQKFGNSFKYDWEHTRYDVSNTAKNFSSLLTLTNYNSASSQSKVREAEKILLKVIRSSAFKKAVLEHRYYLDGKTHSGFSSTTLTPQQVYDKIIDGAESYLRQRNNRMDLTLTLYTDLESNTIGYTYPHQTTVYVNTKYFDQYGPLPVAQNMMHEWLHKIGFNHDYEITPRRPFSVPYAVGYLVRKVIKDLN